MSEILAKSLLLLTSSTTLWKVVNYLAGNLPIVLHFPYGNLTRLASLKLRFCKHFMASSNIYAGSPNYNNLFLASFSMGGKIPARLSVSSSLRRTIICIRMDPNSSWVESVVSINIYMCIIRYTKYQNVCFGGSPSLTKSLQKKCSKPARPVINFLKTWFRRIPRWW